MESIFFQEKYPIYTAEIAKSNCVYNSLSTLISYFKNCIDHEPKVQYIGEFDHLAHTCAIGGVVNPAIEGAVNLVFCFGFALPDPKVLAVRPRSIGIADMGTHFTISFMEAPMPPANEAMKRWVLALGKT
jgi:hypothetical protein